jgi:hypothetical protein
MHRPAMTTPDGLTSRTMPRIAEVIRRGPGQNASMNGEGVPELDLQPPAASSGGGPPKQIRVVGPSHGCVRLAALGCFLHLGCNGRHGRSQPRRLFAAKKLPQAGKGGP